MTVKSSLFLYLTVLTGMFFRLYRFTQTLNMDTDQTAAYIIADRIINHGHRLLVGPLTSLWQINVLPPTYYYLTTFLYFIFRNEVLVSLSFAVIGSLSVYLIFHLGTEMFSAKTGLVSALLFAVSESMIWYGRNMWEPHLVPFFIILTLLALIRAEKTGRNAYLYLSVFSFFLSFLYVSSVLILPAYFFLFYSTFKKINRQKNHHLIKSAGIFLLFAAIFYFPVIVYEYANDFPSLNALNLIFGGGNGFFSVLPSSFLSSFTDHSFLFVRSILIKTGFIQSQIIFLLSAAFLFKLYKAEKGRNKLVLFRLLLIFYPSFLISGLYHRQPEVYRLSSLYPSFFLLAGFLISKFSRLRNILLPLGLIYYLYMNINSALYGINTFKNEKYNAPFDTAGQILAAAQNADFTLYAISPDDKENHHGTSYWWALEKMTGKKLIGLNNRGNWISQELDLNKFSIFLICRDFPAQKVAEISCMEEFRSRYGFEDPQTVKDPGDDFIYKFGNNRFNNPGKFMNPLS